MLRKQESIITVRLAGTSLDGDIASFLVSNTGTLVGGISAVRFILVADGVSVSLNIGKFRTKDGLPVYVEPGKSMEVRLNRVIPGSPKNALFVVDPSFWKAREDRIEKLREAIRFQRIQCFFEPDLVNGGESQSRYPESFLQYINCSRLDSASFYQAVDLEAEWLAEEKKAK